MQIGDLSMKCAVMQPTYLPWAGYFNLILSVDRFFFLDDAQYERGTWQQRNRILVGGQPQWLTVPVRRERLGQSIVEAKIDPLKSSWRRKHAESIRQAYRKSPHRADLEPIVDIILDTDHESLADLNIALIQKFCSMFEIQTQLERTSTMRLDLPRSRKLIEICRRAECDEYISPQGAKEYLNEDRFSDLTEIRISFQDFIPPFYSQTGRADFCSHLSIVDVVAEIGIHATNDYLRVKI